MLHRLLLLWIISLSPMVPLSLAQDQDSFPEDGAQAADPNFVDPAPAESDPNALKLIAQAIKIRGGEANMRAIRSVQSEGTYFMGNKSFPFVSYHTAPSSYRFEYEVEKRYRQKARMVQGTDGQVSWSVDGTAEIPEGIRLPGAEAKALVRSNTLFGPLLDFEQRNIRFAFEGIAKFRGRSVYMVKIYYPDGVREWMYFDQKNGMPVLHSKEEKFANAVRLIDHVYLNYKKVNGVFFPVKIEKVLRGERIGSLEIESIQANLPVDSYLFELPESTRQEFWLRQESSTN